MKKITKIMKRKKSLSSSSSSIPDTRNLNRISRHSPTTTVSLIEILNHDILSFIIGFLSYVPYETTVKGVFFLDYYCIYLNV